MERKEMLLMLLSVLETVSFIVTKGGRDWYKNYYCVWIK